MNNHRKFSFISLILPVLLLARCQNAAREASTASATPQHAITLQPMTMPDPTEYALQMSEPEAVSRSWTAEDLLARYAQEGSPVWADEDELTFFYQGPGDSVMLYGGVQQPLVQLPGTDLWTLTVRIPDLSKAVIGYIFMTMQNGQPINPPASPDIDIPTFRGPDAPPRPERAENLKGKVQDYTIDSVQLKAKRGISVYTPPNYDSKKHYPVIYMGDGQSAIVFARYIEPLILSGELPPLLMVGVHAMDGDIRSYEYIRGIDATIFEPHERFFVNEVLQWAEQNLGVSMERDRRALFGYSNSAYFAVEMGLSYPDRYGAVIAFSVAGNDPWIADSSKWNLNLQSRFYLLYGTLEPYRFHTKRWASFFGLNGFDYSLRERVAGHDIALWQEEFPAAVKWALGG
jgi:enterochelin esterase-like enzyme